MVVAVSTAVVKIEIRVSIGKTSHNFVISGKFRDNCFPNQFEDWEVAITGKTINRKTVRLQVQGRQSIESLSAF